MFTGAEGVEGLLQVKERFDAISETLNFNTGEELFNNFEEVLQDSGASRWQNLITDIAAVDRDVICFNGEYGNLLERYSTNRGRDILEGKSAIARDFARRPVHPVPHDTVGRPA